MEEEEEEGDDDEEEEGGDGSRRRRRGHAAPAPPALAAVAPRRFRLRCVNGARRARSSSSLSAGYAEFEGAESRARTIGAVGIIS